MAIGSILPTHVIQQGYVLNQQKLPWWQNCSQAIFKQGGA